MSGLNYLLQVNCYLLLFYGFYALLLRNETFFSLNRAYLVLTSLLAFGIPLLRFQGMHSFFVSQQVVQAGTLVNMAIRGPSVSAYMPAATEQWGIADWLQVIYLGGVAWFGLRFVKRLRDLRDRFFDDQGAWSFFNRVVIPDDAREHETIYQHERVHALQWHSLDIILLELVAIVNWFNPVMYLVKRSIRQVHEFIADREAAKTRESTADYAYLLVTNAFGVSSKLSSPFFNQSLLKQRILMLHKSPSSKTALFKYALCTPLLAGMLVLSSATIDRHPVRGFHGKIEDVAITTVEMLLPGSSLDKSAVTDTIPQERPSDFSQIDQQPEFPGGYRGLAVYIRENFKWTAAAIERKPPGGRVFASFVVEKDGSVSDVKVIRGLGKDIDDEVLRLLNNMPKWQPGSSKGNPVRVAYTLPLSLSPPTK